MEQTDAGSAPQGKVSRFFRSLGRSLGMIAFSGLGVYLTLCAGAAVPLSSVLISPKTKRTGKLRNPRLKNFLIRKGLRLEDICFTAHDGVRLQGWWVSAWRRRPTVILLHGVKGNRTDMVRHALALKAARFNLLLFDGRHHGMSEGNYVTYGGHEVRDVEAAIDYLATKKRIDRNKVGLVGLSMGAAISLQTAAFHPEIKAVWADSPFASLRRVSKEVVQRFTRLPDPVLKPLEWSTFALVGLRGNFDTEQLNLLPLVSRIQCPVFLVHGDKDQLIPHQHSRDLYDALAGDRHLWIISGASHTSCFKDGGPLYAKRLTEFFSQAFGESPSRSLVA